jgi:two-component system chemotaxis sensor kinase CheA
MDEVVTEFLVESGELLDQMEREMVAFEAGRAGPDAIRTIFRAIHTIKGTCGFLGFQRLASVTHTGENLLSELRDGELTPTPEITSALLALVDATRRTLATIEQTGAEGQPDFTDLIARLGAQLKGAQAHAEPAAPAPVAAAPAPAPAPVQKQAAAPAPVAARPVEPPAPAAVAAAPATPAPAAPKADHPAEAEHSESAASAATIRVGVTLLDKLMTLVGELVLVRNQVLRYANTVENSGFNATSQRLNVLTSELQEGVMKARMQPIGNVFSKLPRVVRDLAHETNKQARVEVIGAETELDKTILESIKDPLTHLVRNAVDHGLELPADRIAAGKNPEGKLVLRAFHEGGQVNIEITDDGRGVNIERVRKKAVERGLLPAEAAARASDREVIGFMFLPGFSTAEKITSVSGRGVGLDVVKTNVEKIGGTVDVTSTAGQGSVFKIKIPLTLAIIPALVVRSNAERYAIPQGSVLEVVRLSGEKAKKGIEFVHASPVYRLRGNLLPLVDLRNILAPGKGSGVLAERENDSVNIVVLHTDRRHFGLVVDGIEDTQEIVVKPLDQGLKGIPVFAGSTIMGDGRVALILDVSGTAQRAKIFAEDLSAKAKKETAGATATKELHRLLLLEARDQGRMAIKLSQVARLEELPRDQVEQAGEQEVIQYRGQIMPLVRVNDILPERRSPERVARDMSRGAPVPEDGPLQVVVHQVGDRNVGIVVDRIVDVIEDSLDVRRPSTRQGVLFSVVIGSRVAELLDVESIVKHADHGAYARQFATGS